MYSTENNNTDEIQKFKEECTFNATIFDIVVKADSVVNDPKYKNILVSVSGGADSDIIVHILSRIDISKKCTYVWFNTGLEYQATKRHLDYLEERYGIKIERKTPKIPIPLSVKLHGYPLFSKNFSGYIHRLQIHGFKWEDDDLGVLLDRYCKRPAPELEEELEEFRRTTGKLYKKPWTYINGGWYTGCVAAIKWWKNDWGEGSQFNINRREGLKEFMMMNPPTFHISDRCCYDAKKAIVHQAIKEYHADLNINGVRKAEGGQRSAAYNSCFSIKKNGCDEYRMLFWMRLPDRREFEQHFGIKHSDCYEVYGQKRTGCCACPFGLQREEELKTAQTYEPKLYTAVCTVFQKSYEYENAYKAYRDEIVSKRKKKGQEGSDTPYHQITLFEYDPEVCICGCSCAGE